MNLYRLAQMDTSSKINFFDDEYEILLTTGDDQFAVKREGDSIFIYEKGQTIKSVQWNYWHALRRYINYFHNNNVPDSLESYQSGACELKLMINTKTKFYYFSPNKPRPQNLSDFLNLLRQAGLDAVRRCE
ncbi:hypothetical protein HUU42_09000 [bacterium]|nr:hypothetical protein [bacterium]